MVSSVFSVHKQLQKYKRLPLRVAMLIHWLPITIVAIPMFLDFNTFSFYDFWGVLEDVSVYETNAVRLDGWFSFSAVFFKRYTLFVCGWIVLTFLISLLSDLYVIYVAWISSDKRLEFF